MFNIDLHLHVIHLNLSVPYMKKTIPDVNQHHIAPIRLDSLRYKASLYTTGQINSSQHIVVIHPQGNTGNFTTQCRDARSEEVKLFLNFMNNFERQ